MAPLRYNQSHSSISTGIYPNTDSWIDARTICTVVDSLQDLISMVWGESTNVVNQSHEWISKRAILSPRNDAVNKINQLILDGIDSPVSHSQFSLNAHHLCPPIVAFIFHCLIFRKLFIHLSIALLRNVMPCTFQLNFWSR